MAPCLTTTHIIHFATTRSQDAAEAAEGAQTPTKQGAPRAGEAAHIHQEDHVLLIKSLQESLLNHPGWTTSSSFDGGSETDE